MPTFVVNDIFQFYTTVYMRVQLVSVYPGTSTVFAAMSTVWFSELPMSYVRRTFCSLSREDDDDHATKENEIPWQNRFIHTGYVLLQLTVQRGMLRHFRAAK